MNLAEFPIKLRFLFAPHRYKVLYGGRGGTKSWGVARALLILGAQRRLRIVCAREIQKSIADSVHALLGDQIDELGLSQYYEVQKNAILGTNGTEFLFVGLRHNINSIKSLEGADIVWVEEAQSVSGSSWKVLIPTVRKEGSEIWISFNPDLESDDTYQRFVVHPPPGAMVVKTSWRDNPWFPQVLKDEAEHLKATNPDEYKHVWEGECDTTLKGAIYANELRLADSAGRVTDVPYDRTRPVDCFWDLGFGDSTAIWFGQAFPFEYRLIDYLESSGKPIQWYLQEMQSRAYLYGFDYLPWDLGMHAKQMANGRSVEEMMRLAGRKVRITPKLSVSEGINAARTLFPQCYFDKTRCADGIQGLRHYRYKEPDVNGVESREPLHDWASHPADAFRYFAVNIKRPAQESKRPARMPRTSPWS